MSTPSPAAVTAVVLADGTIDPAGCLAALAAAAPAPGEVILVDATGAAPAGPAAPGLRLIRVDPASGRAAALDAGAAAARREAGHLLFLHAGVEPEPGFLAPLLEAAAAPGAGVTGLRLTLPDGGLCDGWRLAWAAPFPLTAKPLVDLAPLTCPTAPLEVAAAGGAAMLVEAGLFRSLGGFDAGYWNGLEDVDLCLRAAAAGRRVVIACGSRGRHRGGGAAPRPGHDNEARLCRRWLGRVPLQDLGNLRAHRPAAPRPGRIPLSVVIPLSDALPMVARGLEAARLALGPDDELVLADAGSTDGTAEYAALVARDAAGAARFVASPRELGPAGALAAGLAAASRPVAALLHLADDPAPGLLDEVTGLLAENAGLAFLAFPAPPAGVCVIGDLGALRALAATDAPAFAAATTDELEAAATRAGVAAAFMG